MHYGRPPMLHQYPFPPKAKVHSYSLRADPHAATAVGTPHREATGPKGRPLQQGECNPICRHTRGVLSFSSGTHLRNGREEPPPTQRGVIVDEGIKLDNEVRDFHLKPQTRNMATVA